MHDSVFHEQGSQSWALWWPHEGLQLEEACGHGWVIPFIASLGLDHFFIHGHSSSNALKKVPKDLGRIFWDQGHLSRLDRLPLGRKNSGLEKARETGLETQRECSQDLWSPTRKRSLIPSLGLMVWMLTLLCSAITGWHQTEANRKWEWNWPQVWQHLLVGFQH